MARAAVIVVDMQRGLLQRAKPAHRLDEVVAGINRLTAAARAAGAPVCFVQHDGGADDDVVPGTPGWRLHAELTCADADWRIRKRASDAFHGTPLAAQLAAHGVDAVVICGYASEFCVDSAARRAALLGYRTTVVSDLHTTNDRAHLSAAQIVAHHNFIWSHCSFSGNGVAPRPLDEVIAAELA
ncbi:isochorismatase family protein [Burkholderia pseudomallei]|nr:cysteine hydrolase family protein [Burkholderia pseudomallei]AHE34926.1 isochorismatase family protein [Burkholderia pseudomallei NAU20B-16]AHG33649.1 isochorismatase family protein [Burkholderia pseudomallei MSHR511]AHG68746.1 isochorismatase family protein [Burkholderia pseudomallei MSHR146]AIO14247.1 isochorismatase family protein [Burkholderia pseudomallei]AIO90646.1 isochorismatase family protein [Burkholderia pseudomallei]